MLLEKQNEKIKMIQGDYTNIKITTFEDIEVMREFMNKLLAK